MTIAELAKMHSHVIFLLSPVCSCAHTTIFQGLLHSKFNQLIPLFHQPIVEYNRSRARPQVNFVSSDSFISYFCDGNTHYCKNKRKKRDTEKKMKGPFLPFYISGFLLFIFFFLVDDTSFIHPEEEKAELWNEFPDCCAHFGFPRNCWFTSWLIFKLTFSCLFVWKECTILQHAYCNY